MVMTMCVIVLSYVILGLFLMGFHSRFWHTEKQKLLSTNAGSVAEFASEFTEYDTELNKYMLNGTALSSFIDVLATNIDADIFITDLEGNRLLGVYSCSGIIPEDEDKVDINLVNSALAGINEFRSNFSGFYQRSYYSIGTPFTITDEFGEEKYAGVVFVATESESIEIYQQQTLKIFVIASMVTLAITFFMVSGFTYKLTNPLRQITSAARAFGNGDLSVRVTTDREDEIGELGLAFNSMANSLAQSENMRRSFIANVSHELKTPMTTISGFIDGILDGTIPKSRESHYLKIVSDETKRLSRLVYSMLSLSRIDSGELKLTPVRFDLTDTVFQTLLSFENQITEKNIEIRGLEDVAPVFVVGDKDYIHQVVYNLVENAVKFTNESGYILLSVSDSIDRANVIIENSGIGISTEELPLVFDRFYKTDKSRSRDKKGLGLGLYLCKTIIKQHGGDITVQSEENKFCRFSFYIPKPKQKQKTADAVINLGPSDDDIQDVE